MNWKGIWIPMVTPFRGDKIDTKALEQNVDRLLEANVDGLAPCGTTGEGSSLTDAEFSTVVETVMKRSQGKIPVVPGTGSNNTAKTIERTALAKKLGVDGALVVTPYYVKPTQDGLRKHYQMLSDKVDLPILLYNVPGRTAVNMLPETVEKIVAEANVGGVKDCAALPQIAELIGRVGGKISVLSGEDGVFLPFLSIGGDGIISVVANVIPKVWVSIYQAFQKNDLEWAQKEFLKHTTLTELLFTEPNPIPVKAAMESMDLISGELRTPLVSMTAKKREPLMDELRRLNVVKK